MLPASVRGCAVQTCMRASKASCARSHPSRSRPLSASTPLHGNQGRLRARVLRFDTACRVVWRRVEDFAEFACSSVQLPSAL